MDDDVELKEEGEEGDQGHLSGEDPEGGDDSGHGLRGRTELLGEGEPSEEEGKEGREGQGGAKESSRSQEESGQSQGGGGRAQEGEGGQEGEEEENRQPVDPLRCDDGEGTGRRSGGFPGVHDPGDVSAEAGWEKEVEESPHQVRSNQVVRGGGLRLLLALDEDLPAKRAQVEAEEVKGEGEEEEPGVGLAQNLPEAPQVDLEEEKERPMERPLIHLPTPPAL